LKVPVMAFEPSSMETWSKFCLRNKSLKIIGFAFDTIEIKEPKAFEPSEQQRLDYFIENSTDEAKRLASYLANLPIRYDVARMVQEEKFESTNLTHIAEVFLGGIIERKEQEGSVRFVFRTVPRDYFKVFISPYEAYDLLEIFIQRRGQSSLSLSAFFAHEKGLETLSMDEETLELVRLGIDIKKRMGGTNYDEAIEKEILLDKKVTKVLTPTITPLTKRYQMGSNKTKEEQPIHEVTINYDFEIAQTPVTVGEFRVFVEATGYLTEAEKEDGAYVWDDKNWDKKKDVSWKNPYFEQTDEHPVVCVSWNDAQAYIKWLNEETKVNYRLPTEAEWEYACRAGTDTKWYFGDDKKELDKYAWYNQNSENRTHPVATKEPNPWGLYDIHGNVWEWCLDDYVDNYENTPRDGSANEKGEEGSKVLRGGSWNDNANYTRSAYRGGGFPSDRSSYLGFRLLRTLS